MRKFFFLILFFLLLPFSISGLQLKYPSLPGAPAPRPGISLEEFARYVYHFSLILGGIIAFGAFVYSGFLYLISVGNPLKMRGARDRMVSAVFGLFILFGSYLILITLDPSLVIFQPPKLTPPSSLPPPAKVVAPPTMPKHCAELTTLEGDSKEMIKFLNNQISDLDALINKINIDSFLKDLKDIEKIDCSQAITFCSPKCLDPIAIKCEGKPNNLQNKVENKELNKIKEKIKELIESKEAQRLKGTLNQLSNCHIDYLTQLFISAQAEEKEILKNLGIAKKDPLYFYCCFK